MDNVVLFPFFTVPRKHRKRDTRCSKCQNLFAQDNVRILEEDSKLGIAYVCRICEKKIRRGIDIITTVVCTCCHSEKKKSQALRFKAHKYSIFKNANAEYAIDRRNRILSSDEWICKVCDISLRERKNYHREFKPCSVCQEGICDKKLAEVTKMIESEEIDDVVDREDDFSQKMSEVPQKESDKNIPKEADVEVCPIWVKRSFSNVQSPLYWSQKMADFAGKTSYEELERYILHEKKDEISRIPPIDFLVGNTDFPSYVEDFSARAQIPSDFLMKNSLAVCSRPDLNCFFNSLSIVAYGDQNHAAEMRVRVVIEGVQNKEKYLDQCHLLQGSKELLAYSGNIVHDYLLYSTRAQVNLPEDNCDDYERDKVGYSEMLERNIDRRQQLYETEIFNMRLNKCEAGVWQMHQASSVLQRVVRGVYPGQGRFRIRRFLDRDFCPINGRVNFLDKVNIMWCVYGLGSKPNHFVPIVPRHRGFAMRQERHNLHRILPTSSNLVDLAKNQQEKTPTPTELKESAEFSQTKLMEIQSRTKKVLKRKVNKRQTEKEENSWKEVVHSQKRKSFLKRKISSEEQRMDTLDMFEINEYCDEMMNVERDEEKKELTEENVQKSQSFKQQKIKRRKLNVSQKTTTNEQCPAQGKNNTRKNYAVSLIIFFLTVLLLFLLRNFCLLLLLYNFYCLNIINL